MLELNYRNADAVVIGEENGLNIEEEFNNYKDTITHIIARSMVTVDEFRL